MNHGRPPAKVWPKAGKGHILIKEIQSFLTVLEDRAVSFKVIIIYFDFLRCSGPSTITSVCLSLAAGSAEQWRFMLYLQIISPKGRIKRVKRDYFEHTPL